MTARPPGPLYPYCVKCPKDRSERCCLVLVSLLVLSYSSAPGQISHCTGSRGALSLRYQRRDLHIPIFTIGVFCLLIDEVKIYLLVSLTEDMILRNSLLEVYVVVIELGLQRRLIFHPGKTPRKVSPSCYNKYIKLAIKL